MNICLHFDLKLDVLDPYWMTKYNLYPTTEHLASSTVRDAEPAIAAFFRAGAAFGASFSLPPLLRDFGEDEFVR